MSAARYMSIPASALPRITARLASKSGAPTQGGCVTWTGLLDRYGYAKFNVKHRGHRWHTSAHRIAWIVANGEIRDPSLVIDHLCRNRACVNPAHMELVSNRENLKRGAIPLENRSALGLPVRRVNKNRPMRNGKCKHGHEMTPENTYSRITKEGYTSRSCKRCNSDRQREWNASRAAA